MAWLGIWFEYEAREEGARSPEWLRGLVPPVAYPYVRGFIEAEEERLARSRDPSTIVRDGERFRVFYSLNHDGGLTGLDQQGCRIPNWLFRHFTPDGSSRVARRFSEIPLVIHAVDPARAAALGNAFTLLRFLSAQEDQAIAKILIQPWNPLRGSPQRAAREYEDRVIEFLHGEIFYPEGITLFDVLERLDLKQHRELPACCLSQIGFIAPILDWIDECWPRNEEERAELIPKLRSSLADEARYWRPPPPPPGSPREELPGDFR